MSDFGSAIIISKTDNSNLTTEESTTILNAVEKVKQNNKFENALGEPFKFSQVDAEENEMFFILSEHWYGDGENEENFSFVEEMELDEVESIADLLQTELEGTFEVKGDVMNW